MDFGLQVGLQKTRFFRVFPSCVQEASKKRPRGSQEPQERPKSVPREPQERPKSAQERPREPQERPKLPQIARNGSKLLKIRENYAKLLGIAKNQPNSVSLFAFVGNSEVSPTREDLNSNANGNAKAKAKANAQESFPRPSKSPRVQKHAANREI